MTEPKEQLYEVTVTLRMVVLADSPEQAAEIARSRRHEEDLCVAEATPLSHLPPEWDLESLPYVHRSARNVRDLGSLIDAGHAPQFDEP